MYSRTNQQFRSLCIIIILIILITTCIKLSEMQIDKVPSETKFPLKGLYVVSNRNAVARAETLGPARFVRSVLTSAECCGLKWQNSPSRSAPLRIKPGDSVSEPRCSLPVPWHRASSRHLVNPLTLCDTKRACTQVNACTLTSMQTSVSAICLFTCCGMLLGCVFFPCCRAAACYFCR